MPDIDLTFRVLSIAALLSWQAAAIGCSSPTQEDCSAEKDCEGAEQRTDSADEDPPTNAGKPGGRGNGASTKDGGTSRGDSGTERKDAGNKAPGGDASVPSERDASSARDASPASRGDATSPVDSTDGLDCYTFLAHDAADDKAPFKVGTAVDKYYQFVFAAPWTGTVYGRLFRFIIDNEKVTHHYLIFRDTVPGTPGVQPTVGAHPTGELIHGWAPGPDGENDLDLRKAEDDVGFELPETTYTVEMHYNSNDANAVDASGVEICVTKERPKNIAAVHWLGVDQFLLPSNHWVGTCVPSSQETAHIIQVTPHMHLQGVHMKGIINRADGTSEVLHDEPFDFGYQQGYPKRPTVSIHAGDTITVECDYAQPMAFGPGTNEEMCYLFTIAYPKGVLADGLPAGVLAHGDNACLGL